MAQTPEQKSAYQRDYAARNADRKREAAQRWRDENPERAREGSRRYAQTHREERRERSKQSYWANPEQANQGRRERRRRPGGKAPRERLRAEIVTQFWHEQQGHCYLCGEPVPLEDAVLEHDHRCCPLGGFCQFCIRGVSHHGCNKIIGHAADDPLLLERIAFNLRLKLAEITQRLASKPSQMELGA